jgi:hypothetical protein
LVADQPRTRYLLAAGSAFTGMSNSAGRAVVVGLCPIARMSPACHTRPPIGRLVARWLPARCRSAFRRLRGRQPAGHRWPACRRLAVSDPSRSNGRLSSVRALIAG